MADNVSTVLKDLVKKKRILKKEGRLEMTLLTFLQWGFSLKRMEKTEVIVVKKRQEGLFGCTVEGRNYFWVNVI